MIEKWIHPAVTGQMLRQEEKSETPHMLKQHCVAFLLCNDRFKVIFKIHRLVGRRKRGKFSREGAGQAAKQPGAQWECAGVPFSPLQVNKS